MNIYLIITAGGLLGIFSHALQTIGKINRRTPQTNFKSLFRLYWQSDWFSFLCSFAFFGVLLFIAADFLNLQRVEAPDPAATKEVKDLYWKISVFIRCTSVGTGWFADSIFYNLMGAFEKTVAARFGKQNLQEVA